MDLRQCFHHTHAISQGWGGKIFNLKIWNPCFFSEFKSLMFEGRMDKTAWQRPEFEANNPKFDKRKTLRHYVAFQ